MLYKHCVWNGTIFGQPITKKNSQRIVTNPKTKRPMILPSAQYREYEAKAGAQITPPTEPICTAVNVRCIYFMQNNRACDLTNLMEATHDILVKHKVLADDNNRIIFSVDGSCVLYDKLTPRVEIFIEEVTEDEHR